MISLCRNWDFTENWSEEFASGAVTCKKVDLPHCGREVPQNYALPEQYEMLCGYRKILNLKELCPEDADEVLSGNKRCFVQFDGAAHRAEVFLNGEKLAEHSCGYTSFRAELTGKLTGNSDVLSVKLDSRESLNVPPFGNVIDYLTYAGLYREVWLDVRPLNYIEDIFVYTPDLCTAKAAIKCSGEGKIKVRILSEEGQIEAESECETADGSAVLSITVPDAKPWDTDAPHLYTLTAEFVSKDAQSADVQSVRFGFRTAVFQKDGFYLNGKKLFLRGLNRHQAYPYIGYAAPESLQREDARILKNELACNAVRTSHYPQSRYFIDECDRLGLLVFTEIPGWQHIGDASWKEQACRNTEEMVLQYRNHPSIVLWGVRINESTDDDELYTKTNEIAHRLDPSRQTSGVRYLEKSHLLEDVYAFNDFTHNGTDGPVKPKAKVSPDSEKPFLISECNGHMFPTKSFDFWEKRQEHALRHARVMDAAMASGEHAGCFEWCMFDYPTHKDFGSGNRVCYHGVLDAFRNPKTAAAVYASQGEKPVLELASSMEIGDYPGGQLGDVWAFTNADEIKLYKNNDFVASFKCDKNQWKGLVHGPVKIDDTIGELLKTREGFEGAKESVLKDCLLAAARYGINNMPLSKTIKMGGAMLRYGLTYADGVELYGKYVGNWGGEATCWRFDAVKDGKVVKSVLKTPGSRLHIEAEASKTELSERQSYDMAAVRIRILDENGNPAPFAQLPLKLSVEGNAALVGPDLVSAEGGMTGCYIRTVGKTGSAKLTIRCSQCGDQTIEFNVV